MMRHRRHAEALHRKINLASVAVSVSELLRRRMLITIRTKKVATTRRKRRSRRRTMTTATHLHSLVRRVRFASCTVPSKPPIQLSNRAISARSHAATGRTSLPVTSSLSRSSTRSVTSWKAQSSRTRSFYIANNNLEAHKMIVRLRRSAS